jgi:hypothetical protein
MFRQWSTRRSDFEVSRLSMSLLRNFFRGNMRPDRVLSDMRYCHGKIPTGNEEVGRRITLTSHSPKEVCQNQRPTG